LSTYHCSCNRALNSDFTNSACIKRWWCGLNYTCRACEGTWCWYSISWTRWWCICSKRTIIVCWARYTH
jgi:hypothetical protein